MKIFDLEFELRENYKELPKILDYLNNLIFTDSAIGTVEVINYNYQSNNDPRYYIKIDVMLNSSASSIGIRRDLDGTLSAETDENLVNLFLMQQNGIKYFPLFSSDGKKLSISIYDEISNIKTNQISDDVNMVENINYSFQNLLNLGFNLNNNFPELSNLLLEANKMFKRNASAFISIPVSDTGITILSLNILFHDKSRPSLILNLQLVEGSVPRNQQIEFAKFNFACSPVPNASPISLVQRGKLLKIVLGKSNDKEVQEKIESQFKLLDSIAP